MNKMKYLAGCDEQPVNDRSHFVRLAHPDTSFYLWTVPKAFCPLQEVFRGDTAAVYM